MSNGIRGFRFFSVARRNATPHHTMTTNPSELIASYLVNSPSRGELFFVNYADANRLALSLKLPVVFVYADGSTFEQI